MKTQLYLLLFLIIASTSKGQVAKDAYHMAGNQLKTRWARQVNADNPMNEYPRPQMRRTKWTNLNGLWDYFISKKDAPCPANPDGKILVPYPLESALSGVKKSLLPSQNLWYKRRLLRPKIKGGERVLLHFDAVDWQATIFLNGKILGEHTGGYTAFWFDITDKLKASENELAVKVFDPSDQGIGPHGKQVLNPANIYYTPSSGIWQTVWMETVPADYISELTMVPDIDKSAVSVTVHSKTTADVKLSVAGKTVVVKTNNPVVIPVNNPKLWSPDSPYLYDLTATLGKDQVKSYFGMRKINIQKDAKGIDRIFLNNKYTYNLGTLDQGFWPDGLYTAPTDEALKFDIQAIKAMGFNTIRKHIKVEPARWYYYADKLGIMVWQDMVNPNQGLPEGSKKAFELECKEIMHQLHNYPSITTWVLFNEKWGQYDQERLTKWIKNNDPSRLVNGHSGEYLYVNKELRSPSPNAYIGADMTDVHSYPDPMISIKQEGKAQVCGEFGGIGVPVPGHQWDDIKGWGYVQLKPAELQASYSQMINKLKTLEQRGLSASIYTQPFDVEGEENGLMTYDREVIKIPITTLREIHSSLVKVDPSSLDRQLNIGQNINIDDTDDKYPELVLQFNQGRKDSIFLRRLTLMAIRKNDGNATSQFATAYINELKNIFTRENLLFINHITSGINDPGFKLFKDEPQSVNAILGTNTAENKVMGIIQSEEIEPFTKSENPDWGAIEKKLVREYGPLGQELVSGNMLVYYWSKKDWVMFAKYYKSYFDFAIPNQRSFVHINNLSWSVFEHVKDLDVLETAIKAMKYNIDHFPSLDGSDYDTYANLLYKIGRKDDAVKMEENAVWISKGNDEIKLNLEKMKRGEKTWKE